MLALVGRTCHVMDFDVKEEEQTYLVGWPKRKSVLSWPCFLCMIQTYCMWETLLYPICFRLRNGSIYLDPRYIILKKSRQETSLWVSIRRPAMLLSSPRVWKM